MIPTLGLRHPRDQLSHLIEPGGSLALAMPPAYVRISVAYPYSSVTMIAHNSACVTLMP